MARWDLGGRSLPRVVVVTCVTAIVAVAVLASVAPDAYATLVVENLVWVGSAALASIACARAAVRTIRVWRMGWVLLSITTGLWAAANVGWGVYDLVLHQPVPLPSPTDLLYLPAQLTALVGIFVLCRPMLRTSQAWRALLELVLVVVSLCYLLATTLLADPDAGLTGPLAQVVAWAYPLTDILLIAVGVVALSRVPRNILRVAVPIAGGFVAIGIGDTLWAFNMLTGEHLGAALSCVLYVVGYLGIALAAASRRTTPPADDRPSPLLVRQLPNLVVVSAVIALILQHAAEAYPEVLGLGVVILLFVRQVLAMHENQRLNQDLELRVAARTEELSASEALFRTMAHTVSDSVLIIDDAGVVRYSSPGLARMGSFSLEGERGDDLLRFVHPDDVAKAAEVAETVRTTPGASATTRVRLTSPAGEHAVADATLTNLKDDPSIGGFVLSMRDVTEEAALLEVLRYQAYHDELTALPNRAALLVELHARTADGSLPSVILLDLDAFKAVNDSLGHAVGDQLLVLVAERLRTALAERGLLARVSGDEFAVVVDPSLDAMAIANELHRSLDRPFVIGERPLQCPASFGVAGVGDDPGSLLRNADLAMYEAKEKGRGRVESFAPRMHRRLVDRLDLEADLATAADDGTLFLVYQPVMDLHTGEVLGAEALVRWQRTPDQLVDPGTFIPIAEETRLIDGIGRWVLEHACMAAAGWQHLRPDGRPPTVAVNASVRQLVDHDLVGDVQAALRLSGLPGSCLTIELTESAVMDHDEALLQRLLALKALGVKLSIDDFGTGYSSLGRLRFLPVDELKIDRSFVSRDGTEAIDAPVIDAVLALAASLDLEVVAEGIEHASQLAGLRSRGCHRAQGYLLGRPMTSLAFEQRLLSAPAPRRDDTDLTTLVR